MPVSSSTAVQCVKLLLRFLSIGVTTTSWLKGDCGRISVVVSDGAALATLTLSLPSYVTMVGVNFGRRRR